VATVASAHAVLVADGLQACSSCWKAPQPPKSSMTSLYLISERFSARLPGSGAPSQRSLKKPPASVP
jgi:hypothetical protein